MVGSTLIRAGHLAPLILLFTVSISKGQNSTSAQRTAILKDQVVREVSQYPAAQVAVAFKDLQSGAELFINEDRFFHAASTMKTPVMAALFAQSAVGKFDLDDTITVYNRFKSIADGSEYQVNSADDSEQDLYKAVGTPVLISDLMLRMITKSSNLATNMLIDKVGVNAVKETMHIIGADNIKVLRGVEDQKAFDQGMNNMVTAKDLMLLFEQIALGRLVNRDASQKMIAILMQQRLKGAIPAKLPSAVRVANKTGSITRVLNDSGIVFLPDGRKYVLVLLSRGLEPEPAIQLLSDISLLIYQHTQHN